MPQAAEFAIKRRRVAEWLESRGADAVLLASCPNVYWLGVGCESGRVQAPAMGFVVNRERCWLLWPSDDAERVRQEEVRGFDLEIVPLPQLGAEPLVERARELAISSARWTCDLPGLGLEHDPSCDALRRDLLPEEIERLRKLGRDAAAALEDVASECFRGILERDAGARLAAECLRRQIVPRVVLAGADERVESYPRPLPKGGGAERVLLLGLVGMRAGLHVALSRLVCLARPDEQHVERYAAAVQQVARLCHAARPGETLGTVAQNAVPDRRAGGASVGAVIGYAFPEADVRPASRERLAAGRAVTWNVVAPGVRCEDTYLVTESGCELLTATDGWPRRSVHLDGRTYEIPDLMLL